MGDFKRSSSRFSRGGGGASSGGGNLPAPRENNAPQGNGGGRSFGGGGGNNNGGGQGQGGNFPFTRIASLSAPKGASNDQKDYIERELRGLDLNMTAKIYLGKGDNELTLKNGDMLLITFKVSDKDKDFVVGHVSVKN